MTFHINLDDLHDECDGSVVSHSSFCRHFGDALIYLVNEISIRSTARIPRDRGSFDERCNTSCWLRLNKNSQNALKNSEKYSDTKSAVRRKIPALFSNDPSRWSTRKKFNLVRTKSRDEMLCPRLFFWTWRLIFFVMSKSGRKSLCCSVFHLAQSVILHRLPRSFRWISQCLMLVLQNIAVACKSCLLMVAAHRNRPSA